MTHASDAAGKLVAPMIRVAAVMFKASIGVLLLSGTVFVSGTVYHTMVTEFVSAACC